MKRIKKTEKKNTAELNKAERKERRKLRKMILGLIKEKHLEDASEFYSDYRRKFGKLRVAEKLHDRIAGTGGDEKPPKEKKTRKTKTATLPMRLRGRAADRLTDALKKLEAANLEIESEIARLESRVHALCAEKDAVRNGIQNVIRIIKRLAGKGGKGNK